MTEIVITGLDLLPYAIRGAVQTLEPIQQSSQMERTVNGSLLDISDPLFTKYTSTITGVDQEPPAFDGVFPGKTVTVDCSLELVYKTSGGSPNRPVVPGSSRIVGDYTFYRPRLTMKVITFNVDYNEWAAMVSWSIQLEEV